MHQRCADTNFGIDSNAVTLVHLLSGEIPEFAEFDDSKDTYSVNIKTYALYNGLEQGVCLVVSFTENDLNSLALAISFGTERGSEDIFIDYWHTVSGDVPSSHNRPEKVSRQLFKPSWIGVAKDFILSLMWNFLSEAPRFQSVRL